VRYEYNPAKARELLQQAGYDGKGKRVKSSMLISTSGSGQMLPLPMNEFIQENLRDVGIDLELVTIEWNAMIQRYRQGLQHPANAQLGGMNISLAPVEPHGGLVLRFYSTSVPPNGLNVMSYNNPEVDRLFDAASAAFDPPERDHLLAQAHEIIVDDAPWVFIVHDLNPRGLSPKVKGFVQAQSWFQDLTPVWVEK
jgi:ABC-type transport system substrate-binding protein